MDRVVVDTDVLSFYLKNDSRFASYAQELDGKQLVISFQTHAELMLWQEIHNWGTARRDRVKNLIAQQFIVFPVDEQLCRTWAQLRSDVQKAGRVLHVTDPGSLQPPSHWQCRWLLTTPVTSRMCQDYR